MSWQARVREAMIATTHTLTCSAPHLRTRLFFRMQKKVFEPTGFIPRSISRTVYRFFLQSWPSRTQQAQDILLDEFRRSRTQAIVSIQCLASLIFIPYFSTWLLKSFCIQPLVQNMWMSSEHPLFVNTYQKHRAYVQLQEYQNRRLFDHLLGLQYEDIPSVQVIGQKGDVLGLAMPASVPQKISLPELRQHWQAEASRDMEAVVTMSTTSTITAVTNAIGDLCGVGIFFTVGAVLKRQRLILQSFVAESLYSLSDTTKSFLLILVTDGIVGFHSSIGWQSLGEALLERFGFAPQNDLMLLFVSTCPVLLNTMFKYWVFRYLNKISPSTVAIYHNMIE